ncbi:hypothetical protein A3K63_02955 [Candidatus Micrarchaeota archaeon RBG_16_49_10]|nr:MAG: hypothetical protein A3K63_02955 [Candidatus Micrarchaeota archaeon RBG_16_49_10]
MYLQRVDPISRDGSEPTGHKIVFEPIGPRYSLNFLSSTQLRVLKRIYCAEGHPVTSLELAKGIYGFVDESTIKDVYTIIAKTRTLLRENKLPDDQIIITDLVRGYRFGYGHWGIFDIDCA